MMFFSKKGSLGTIFLKEDENIEVHINKMKDLASKATGELKKEIETQIRFSRSGKDGEDNIAYELKNSGLDMYVLQDLYLEYNELSSQIDYIVIARNKTYIIESKNLNGNIEVDKDGNFIRTYTLNNEYVMEGMYSPITQNERHKEIIKQIMLGNSGLIMSKIIDKLFDSWFQAVVVLANPKTILNDKNAPLKIQNQIIRADGLIRYIKDCEIKGNETRNNEDMLNLAQKFLKRNVESRKDYSLKYENLVNQQLSSKQDESTKISQDKICPKCGSILVVKEAKKGFHKGNKFYGCASFPNCEHIENI